MHQAKQNPPAVSIKCDCPSKSLEQVVPIASERSSKSLEQVESIISRHPSTSLERVVSTNSNHLSKSSEPVESIKCDRPSESHESLMLITLVLAISSTCDSFFGRRIDEVLEPLWLSGYYRFLCSHKYDIFDGGGITNYEYSIGQCILS